jgi:hypothetical protein
MGTPPQGRSDPEHDFTDRFTRRYHTPPTWYTAEAFDAANILPSNFRLFRYAV